MSETVEPAKRPARKVWNYTPALPLRLAPYWDWPIRPLASVLYLLKSWNPIAMRFVMLPTAIATWLWFTPDIERAQTIAFGWIFEVWLRNFIILTGVAGGLHLFLLRSGRDFISIGCTGCFTSASSTAGSMHGITRTSTRVPGRVLRCTRSRAFS